MRVTKRSGELEEVQFDKILNKNTMLTATSKALGKKHDNILSNLEPLEEVDASFITQQTIKGIYDCITTQELDTYSASVAQSLSLVNPQYSTLAGRIMASNLQKNILTQLSMNFQKPEEEIKKTLFLYVTRALWNNKNTQGVHAPLIAPYYMATVEKNAEWFESQFKYYNDYNIDYMGYSILEGAY